MRMLDKYKYWVCDNEKKWGMGWASRTTSIMLMFQLINEYVHVVHLF